MKRIGILGGTFDPPHLGHLLIAEEARIALELEEVWFIPTYEPPHKHEASTKGTDRVHMVEQAIYNNKNFKVSTIEIDRLGKSYTFDTMSTLKEEANEAKFFFIIGADMVEYLPHWHNIDRLVDMVTFVGVKRSGFRLNSKYPIIKIDIPLIEISSTFIRERLKANKTVKYLIPDSVYTYIKEKRLYED
ncbi:nicotinate-nucleotide adenylyltransferase [Virgibacillus alimentarius]|uniref:nicotinate-nucleotide adenylyltransferase n=1 Tax=Virgibacillus alimentarius TaxID=698769 RepID=UPI000492F424|nr:nicotinate-nucleotide adenylyltransferase [Virgibacillus alimentarius]